MTYNEDGREIFLKKNNELANLCAEQEIKEEDQMVQDCAQIECAESTLKGRKLYFSIASSMLGAGVLFLHSALIGGGLLAFVLAVILSVTGILSITECIFRTRKNNLAAEEPSSGIKQVTYASFANLKPKYIQGILIFSLIVQSANSILIYQTLIWGWIYSIIEFLFGSIFHMENIYIKNIQTVLSVPLLFILWMYCINKSPGDSKYIQLIATVSIMSLTILLGTLLVIFYNVFELKMPDASVWRSLVIGKTPSVFNFCTSIATAFFGLNSHCNIPIYLDRVKLKNKRSMLYPMAITSSLVYFTFFIVGVEGYFLVFANNLNGVNSDILSAMSLALASTSKMSFATAYILTEVLVSLFKLAISIILLNSYMWQAFTYRALIMDFCHTVRYKNNGEKRLPFLEKLADVIPQAAKDFFTETVPNAFYRAVQRLPKRIQERLGVYKDDTESSLDGSENESDTVLRYVVGSVIFALTTVLAIIGLDLTLIIQLSGAVIASFISILVPAILLYHNRHISAKKNKRWFDNIVITVLLFGFMLLVSTGFAKTYYEISNASVINTTAGINATEAAEISLHGE
ncbi:uncharacterized protein NESG_02146 [Nematocida ausubeli]|uniref:Amino acid transporter transmembrane domain-containing protein n=1 Tax=Nematocida ausubeli (strain ATCC PRA-371 / ERTm2) TaxID=1913371 RepID=A0A086IZQ4_NEMA1|nr:uncharacterized protein NESG_02146 [Nematocida ausubeli]KFG25372.1 hypothetical protein NESG_02146 [Nematocida ausubeli]